MSNRVYVGNLSWSTNWQNLKDYMRQAGTVLYADVLTESGTGRSKGCGVVEYETADEAANAIATLSNTELDGRLIFVREDREAGKVTVGRAPAPRVVARGPPAAHGGAGRQLFVQNLPWSVTWQELKDVFRQAGEVERADVLLTNDGRSRGNGIVLMLDASGAENAIQMFNGSELGGRVITVGLDKFAAQ
eukprot:tig00000912_g5410.t1